MGVGASINMCWAGLLSGNAESGSSLEVSSCQSTRIRLAFVPLPAASKGIWHWQLTPYTPVNLSIGAENGGKATGQGSCNCLYLWAGTLHLVVGNSSCPHSWGKV